MTKEIIGGLKSKQEMLEASSIVELEESLRQYASGRARAETDITKYEGLIQEERNYIERAKEEEKLIRAELDKKKASVS